MFVNVVSNENEKKQSRGKLKMKAVKISGICIDSYENGRISQISHALYYSIIALH